MNSNFGQLDGYYPVRDQIDQLDYAFVTLSLEIERAQTSDVWDTEDMRTSLDFIMHYIDGINRFYRQHNIVFWDDSIQCLNRIRNETNAPHAVQTSTVGFSKNDLIEFLQFVSDDYDRYCEWFVDRFTPPETIDM